MTAKLTPDQLHRLIDEVAALAYRDEVDLIDLLDACDSAGCATWLDLRVDAIYFYAYNECLASGRTMEEARFAGLSAVLILLSEGG